MRWPVFAAIVPELVPRPQLPAALALNGVAMNASRIIGPLVAGAIIASAGSAWVFALNAVLSLAAGFIIMRWRREHKESPLGRERLASAMRVGVQFVWQSARMRAVLLRISLFFLHSTALLALLPLVARGLPGGAAGTFTVLLASMGAGAIVAALLMPRIRKLLPLQTLLFGGHRAAGRRGAGRWRSRPTSTSPCRPCSFAGVAWITVANSLTVAAQMALARLGAGPRHVDLPDGADGLHRGGRRAVGPGRHLDQHPRQRWRSPRSSSVVLMALAQRLVVDRGIEEDLTPSQRASRCRRREAPPQAGPHPGATSNTASTRRAPAEFLELMQESRRSRMRQGALDWQVLHDLYDPGRFVEQITDESWTEHLRRFDRVTAADVQLRDRKLAFHIGEEPPRVTRFLIRACMGLTQGISAYVQRVTCTLVKAQR